MSTVLTQEPAGASPAGSRASTPPATAQSAPPPSRLVLGLRHAAVVLGFLGLVLTQQPGRVVPDTKLDLAVDPLAFLERALRLWEPEGFGGQVQNQAYGYLFPMGPFFALGDAAGIPTWIVQRLWWALLLCVAYFGVVRLARALGLGTPATRIVGGLAYALAPRMVSGIGLTSVEVLPMAVAPWVLVPLVAGARAGSPRRAAALSGVAVLCIGGVNAVATAAVLPLAALWLLMLPGGPRKRRLIGWWTASVALATAWWVGPLLLLGRYSTPFLDHIETATTTTAGTELVQVLRGTSQWFAGLGGPRGPQWPAGWDLLSAALPVAGTLVVAAAGLAALARQDMPHRRWLVLGVLTGVALVSAGHVASVAGAGAGSMRDLLDGVLAPLRNLHKFDPVVRLPLVLGLVHLVAVLLRPRRRTGRRLLGAAAAALVVAGVAATAQPAVAGRLTPPTGFTDVPVYWQETASWLAAQQQSGRALLVPASSFGTYIWGTTGDEPLQPLAESSWGVRNAIPLTPTGHIRGLDAVEDRLGRGQGSAGLTRFLARSGYSHLVVRNDLDAPAARTSRLALVRQALDDSPGIVRVAGFGPELFAGNGLSGIVTDGRVDSPVPAVAVYAVDGTVPSAYTVPLSSTVEVVGGPDAVLALEEHGLLRNRTAIVAGAQVAPTGGTLVSDALVRRERNPGAVVGSASAGLTPADPLRLDRPVRDYLIPGHEANESFVRIAGATVTASGSGADADNGLGVRPGEHPFAAVDGDPATAWRPAPVPARPGGVWWQIDLDRPLPNGEIRLRLDDATAAAPPDRVRVVTDSGSTSLRLAPGDRSLRVVLPEGSTRSIRLVAEPDTGSGDPVVFGLAEVSVPGLEVSRTVVLPAPSGSDEAVEGFSFDASNPPGHGCVADGGGRPRCLPSLVTSAEEPHGLDRAFTVPAPADYGLAVTARPRPGAALDRLIASAAGGVRARSNGSVVPDPRAGPWAAVDGDPATAWLAAPGPGERLRVSWPTEQRITQIRVHYTAGTAAARPLVLTLRAGGAERLVTLDRRGIATFPALVTDSLSIDFLTRVELTSLDTYTGERSELGVGVSELEIPGVPSLSVDARVDLACGEGPDVVVDGVRYPTSAQATVRELLDLRPLELTICPPAAAAAPGGAPAPGTLSLDAGEHSLVAASTAALGVESATLRRVGTALPVTAERRAVDAGRWEAENRVLEIDRRDQPTLLVVPENVNDGWRATLDGDPLRAVQVDGWQQGYLVPPGAAGVVELTFEPGSAYRTALLAGAAAAALLVVLARVPARHRAPTPSRRPGRGVPSVLVAAAAGGLLLAIGGLWSLLAVAVVAAVFGRARRYRALALVSTACVLAAGALLAAGDAVEPVRQLLVLTALAGVVLSVCAPASSAGPARRAGSGA